MDDLRIVPVDNAELLMNVAELANDIWHEYFTKIIGKEQVEYMLETFQSFDAINNQIVKEGYEYFVLIYEYMMSGYIGFKEEEDNTLFLSKLYVHEDCRGNHISTNVIRYLTGICKKRNLSAIRLRCNRHNTNTLEIYKHLGFQIIAEDCSDIGNGFVMDDYIMEKKIEE